jgi:hypothetical protein
MRAAAVALVVAALPAAAQDVKTPQELARIRAASQPHGVDWRRPTFSFAPRFGIAAGDLDFAPTVGLQFAHAPGAAAKALVLALDVSWKPTSLQERFSTYRIDVHDFAAAALISYHAYSDKYFVVPFVGAGPGLRAMHAVTRFPDVGSRSEKELRLAVLALAGLKIHLGAGAIEVEGRVQYSPSETRTLRGSSILPYTGTVGYRFSL